MRKLLSLTLLALAGSTAFAGGYRVSIQGQKQLAMGHTGVAVVNSAEVAFFNPAGMVYLVWIKWDALALARLFRRA